MRAAERERERERERDKEVVALQLAIVHSLRIVIVGVLHSRGFFPSRVFHAKPCAFESLSVFFDFLLH